MAETQGDRRLPSLTGLRVVAALAVFGFHVAVADPAAAGHGMPATVQWLVRAGRVSPWLAGRLATAA